MAENDSNSDQDSREMNPQTEFSFIAHDYKLNEDKKDEDGNRLVDRLVLQTKSPEVNRGRVTHNLEVEKTIREQGKKVTTTGSPRLSNLPEKVDKITEALDNGELVQVTATVTEIQPDDGDPYHSIFQNHRRTMEARILKGEDAEKWRNEHFRDDSGEEETEEIL